MKFGIDVGGTTIKIGVVENNKIIQKYEIKTNKNSLFQEICLFLKEYMQLNHIEKIEGIGFGLPGNVVGYYVEKLPNLGIENIDLYKEISKYFPNTPIAVQNDANVAALGEMTYHNQYKSACMITLGTGVGCGIVLDGKIVKGVHGAAGEVGHLLITEPYHFQCECGLVGCLETVASATGIVRLAKYHYADYQTNLSNSFTAKDVFELAKKADPLCIYVVDRVAYYVAKCLSILALVVDVEVFYIGGGVSLAGNFLLEKIKKHYQEIAHYAVKKIKIELATLLNDAGMLGAARLIGNE